MENRARSSKVEAVMRAIRVNEFGGPPVLVSENLVDPVPTGDEVLVRLEAIGVNFIDVYHRTGRYDIAPPFTPGMEGAGVVQAVGDEVTGFAVGDRVASAMQIGSYAELQAIPAAEAVKLPDGIETKEAAAVMLQGMTAHYLAHSTFELEPDHTALVHAGAGGVGRLLIQMAKRIGARVITTVGTEAKAAIARALGPDEVIVYTEDDFLEKVHRLTDGVGVDVVYDAVGISTFDRSLNALKPRGMLVLYGAASGAVPPVDPIALMAKGSLYLTRPSLAAYVSTREDLIRRSEDIFTWVSSGELHLHIDRELPLAQASEAHTALEGRDTIGKVLLIP